MSSYIKSCYNYTTHIKLLSITIIAQLSAISLYTLHNKIHMYC